MDTDADEMRTNTERTQNEHGTDTETWNLSGESALVYGSCVGAVSVSVIVP